MVIQSIFYIVFWVDRNDPTETRNSPPVGASEARRIVKNCLADGDEQVTIVRYQSVSRFEPRVVYGLDELEDE